jgi:predicted DsbA family dithiol-disulfide isomerase
MKVDIYSDVACPWCYIGQAHFERALASFDGADRLDVRHRPYQLDPHAPSQAEPMLEYLARRFGARSRDMANEITARGRVEGLEMDYDRGLAVNTLNAHRLLALAEREYGADMQRTLMRRLFAAHFSEGRDVGDPRVLAELAGDVGMDAAAAHEYLKSDAGAREVKQAIAEAQQLGITAVPTFVFDDKYVVEGAQPADLFLQALNLVAKESSPEARTSPNDELARG